MMAKNNVFSVALDVYNTVHHHYNYKIQKGNFRKMWKAVFESSLGELVKKIRLM